LGICCSYETAISDAALKANFAAYLRSSFGRQGIKNMSEVTVGLYVSCLFSLKRANSFKQYLRRTGGFNADFELQELMFRPNVPIFIQVPQRGKIMEITKLRKYMDPLK
jgi:hypothetical protein